MATAILEINDSGIQWLDNERCRVSPGYAIVTDTGIITGAPALLRAWLEPQRSFNHYWHQLNLAPLPLRTDHARHTADLAFAQLQQLHRDMGTPEQVIFSVPSNTSNDQLSLLLGLVKAAGFSAAGVVDAAVAASVDCGRRGNLLYLDIQLHTAVLTELDATSTITRRAVESLPEVGLKTLYDGWAQWIANGFIQQYRYDPLHTAAGEQQLRDRLPDWLEALRDKSELAVELSAPQGTFRLNLLRSELIAVNARRFDRLIQAVAQHPRGTLLLSHRLAALPGLTERLTERLNGATVLEQHSALSGCQLSADSICSPAQEPLRFITALPAAPTRPMPGGHVEHPAPTHIVYRHRAYAIGAGLGIFRADDGLAFGVSGAAPTALVFAEGKLALHTSEKDVACRGAPTQLLSGDQIAIGEESIGLIEVL